MQKKFYVKKDAPKRTSIITIKWPFGQSNPLCIVP